MLIFNTEKAAFWQTAKAIPVINLALFSAPLGVEVLLYAMTACTMIWTEANHGISPVAAGGSGFPAQLLSELPETAA